RGGGARSAGSSALTASCPPAVAEDHDSCRNPNGDAAPWCYVRGAAGIAERRTCEIPPCPDATATTAPVPTAEVNISQEVNQVFEPADTLPSRSEAAAVQPVIGISQRVQMNSREKKDLGTLGYVLGLIMMVIIIAIGAGIVVGYIYKRSVATLLCPKAVLGIKSLIQIRNI
uniref:Phosphoinositide-3-kinase interacting protein 1 n=1 Tax=Chrysolophus pictus TaxID=9089 RepID=A0A8C3LCG9_CHRPC